MTRPSHRIASALCCFALSIGLVAAATDPCYLVSPTNNSGLVALTVLSGVAGEPVFVTHPPNDTDRIFIATKSGTILVKHRGNPTPTTFLTIPGVLWASGFGEQGLLGMAFDPDYENNGFFYVYYTRSSDTDQIVARFSRDTTPPIDPDLADPASQTILMRMADSESNHNGGNLAFGLDGYLYIATGDGGGGGDGHGTCGNGQNRTSLLGKLLRIAPNAVTGTNPDCPFNTSNYLIPASNPLADGPGGNCDEIWAYGLRNPFRFSFDSANGDLYIGDVGQNCWEEIDYTPSTSTGGENYGWRQFEGRHCFDPSEPGCNDIDTASCAGGPGGSTPACSDPGGLGNAAPNGTRLPVFDYSHSLGCSVTGGYVYRGCRMNTFQGKYFYADACAALVRSFEVVGGTASNHQSWMDLGSNNFASFGVDGQGEIYIARLDGTVNLLAPPLPDFEVSGTDADPFRLSRNGDWTWENLAFTSQHPITTYHVYRADILDNVFDAGESFNCIFSTSGTSWTLGGDLVDPPPNAFFAYIVRARNASGEFTSPGGNPTRTIGAAACP